MSIEKLLETHISTMNGLHAAIVALTQALSHPTGKVPEKKVEDAKSIFDESEAAPKKSAKAAAKSTESSSTSGKQQTTAAAQPARTAVDMTELRKELTAAVLSVAKMDAEGVAATRAIFGEYGVKKANEIPDNKVVECLEKFKAAKAKLDGNDAAEDEDFI